MERGVESARAFRVSGCSKLRIEWTSESSESLGISRRLPREIFDASLTRAEK